MASGSLVMPLNVGWVTLVIPSESETPESLAELRCPVTVNGPPVTVAVLVRFTLEPSVPTTWIESGNVDRGLGGGGRSRRAVEVGVRVRAADLERRDCRGAGDRE